MAKEYDSAPTPKLADIFAAGANPRTESEKRLLEDMQATMNDMIDKELPEVLKGGTPQVMEWLNEYIDMIRQPGVDARAGDVLKRFEGHYSKEDRLSQDNMNKEPYGRKAVGVVLKALEDGYAVRYEAFSDWYTRYSELSPKTRRRPAATFP